MTIFRNIICLMLPLFAAGASALDYKQGLDAFRVQDYQNALTGWKDLADKGDAKAQYGLGVMYSSALGVTQNEKAAFDWYRKSASQGYAPALFNVGYMYEHGVGIKADLKSAVRDYSLAAEQGDAMAQANLGRLTYLGHGTTRNPVIAYALFYVAGTQNVTSAIRNQRLVYSEMNDSQQKQARELSEEFYQRYVIKTRW